MDAIRYLYGRILVNRVKMALRRPVTYFYLILLLFYFCALPFSLRVMAGQFGIDSPKGFAGVLTVIAVWMIPANLVAYAKRKGLVYRNSDVHFLFPAPVGPKQILVYAYVRTLLIQVLMNLFAIVCGAMTFRVEGWRLALYFVFSVFVENFMEGCIMILLYGSERLGEKRRRMVIVGAYGLACILVLLGVYSYLQGGLSMTAVSAFLHGDMIQMVPLTGWYIAVVHLLFAEPTAASVAGAACYLLLFVAVTAAALRMKCTGAYYEDAMKFAEDYEEVLESRRQGDAQRRLGKKTKYAKASIRWRGQGGSALFSRQLLEYKKSRYFIFDINTVMAALAGAGIAYLYVREGGFGEIPGEFVIPGVSAYLIFIFTNLNGKWAKELKSPYTYLIPDTPFRKLMGATMMQCVQALVNGCLITVPAALAMGLAPSRTALCVAFYVALTANKLYALAVAEVVTGNTLGNLGRQLLQMLLQSVAIFVAVMGAVVGMRGDGILSALVLMDVFLALFTLIFMVIATLNFYNMEAAS